jgi:tRNA-specific 2-thiouridylase
VSGFQEQLAKTLFHSDLQRAQCEMAVPQNLITAGKKDSQELCFIGSALPDFQQRTASQNGNIIEIPTELLPGMAELSSDDEVSSLAKANLSRTDELKGQHQGAHYFVCGQRRGLNVYLPEPLPS